MSTTQIQTKIQQGQIGKITDQWGHTHNNCIAVMVNPDKILAYDPEFHEAYIVELAIFKPTNLSTSDQDRKNNIIYANQHFHAFQERVFANVANGEVFNDDITQNVDFFLWKWEK